jgi:hypothetical protein
MARLSLSVYVVSHRLVLLFHRLYSIALACKNCETTGVSNRPYENLCAVRKLMSKGATLDSSIKFASKEVTVPNSLHGRVNSVHQDLLGLHKSIPSSARLRQRRGRSQAQDFGDRNWCFQHVYGET